MLYSPSKSEALTPCIDYENILNCLGFHFFKDISRTIGKSIFFKDISKKAIFQGHFILLKNNSRMWLPCNVSGYKLSNRTHHEELEEEHHTPCRVQMEKCIEGGAVT